MKWSGCISGLLLLLIFWCASAHLYSQTTPEDSLKKEETRVWWKRIRPGMDVTIYPGSYFTASLGPVLSYSVNQRITITGGIFYKPGFPRKSSEMSHDFGAKVQLWYRVWGGLTAISEYEWVRYRPENAVFRKDNHALTFGGGYAYSFHKQKRMALFLSYDVLNSLDEIPYPGSFMLRYGIWF